MCVTSNAPLASLVHQFAAGKFDTTSLARGVYLEARLRSISHVESSTAPARRDSFHAGRIAFDFTITHAWTRPGVAAPLDSVRFFAPAVSPCPIPAWKLDQTYLIFAYPVADTLRALTPCSAVYPRESKETAEAVAALDSLLVRRR